MALFLQIMLTVFIAEMGDKTQLMMIAMTSRYKVRDIILGAGAAILVLNAMAVGVGALVSSLIPPYIIKLAAALAFFYFAWASLKPEDEEEEGAHRGGGNTAPILAVFGTFFLAELGDKTQLTAIAFAANAGLSQAVLVWLACSAGLFAADVIGMLVGYLLKSKLPEGFLNDLAFVIFAVFGVITMKEGTALLLGGGAAHWAVTAAVTALFAAACIVTLRKARGGAKAEK